MTSITLKQYVSSLNFVSSFPEVEELLTHATTDTTKWGNRKIVVENYSVCMKETQEMASVSGRISLEKIVKMMLSTKKKYDTSELSPQECEAERKIFAHLKQFYLDTDLQFWNDDDTDTSLKVMVPGVIALCKEGWDRVKIRTYRPPIPKPSLRQKLEMLHMHDE